MSAPSEGDRPVDLPERPPPVSVPPTGEASGEVPDQAMPEGVRETEQTIRAISRLEESN